MSSGSTFMHGWLNGAESELPDPSPGSSEDYKRGYAAGRLAYFAAERAERERLDGTCPVCQMGAALKAQGPAPVGIDHLASYVDDLRAQVAALAALAADAGPEVK